MSKKDNIEGYIPYLLGGAVVGAIAINYLSYNSHSFATSSSGGSEGGSSSSGSHIQTGHHSSSHSSGSKSHGSHPAQQHHTTTKAATQHKASPHTHHIAPTHHDNPLTVHHNTHTTPHTAVHKVTHPAVTHAETQQQAHPDNDNLGGFGLHKATGFGGGGGRGFGGGGGGGPGFGGGGGGGFNQRGGGPHGPPGGGGGGFGHTGPGPGGQGFGGSHHGGHGGQTGGDNNGGHHGSHQHNTHHNQHQTHDNTHTTPQSHGRNQHGRHSDIGGGTGTSSQGSNNDQSTFHGMPDKTNIEHNKTASIGEHFKGKVTPWSPPSRANVPTNTSATKTVSAAQRDQSGTYDQSQDGGNPKSGKPKEGSFKTNLNTSSKVNRLFDSTGRSVDGTNFGTDNEDNHGNPSNRFVGYHDFKNFEATSYQTVKSTNNKDGYAMIETGGPTQNNNSHNCCDYSIGVRTDGRLYAKEEGDHYGKTGGDDGDLVNIGHWRNFKTTGLKPGDTFGLKTVLMRDLKDANGNQHTRLIGYIDRQNNGKWQKMIDVTDPYGISNHTKQPFPVITDTSMHGDHVQEARTRVEDMGDTGFHPNYTDVHEIDMSKYDNNGNPLQNTSTATATPRQPTRTIPTPHPTGNTLNSNRPRTTSPLTTHTIGGGGHHFIDTSNTRPGAQAPGEGAIQATLGGAFTNLNNRNTNTTHSIRPPTTPSQQRHSITGDFFNTVQHDIAGTPTPQQRQQQRHSITGDFFDMASRDIANTPNPHRPINNRGFEYMSPEGPIGISNVPLTDAELTSNLAISTDNTLNYIALAALIGIPLALYLNLL